MGTHTGQCGTPSSPRMDPWSASYSALGTIGWKWSYTPDTTIRGINRPGFPAPVCSSRAALASAPSVAGSKPLRRRSPDMSTGRWSDPTAGSEAWHHTHLRAPHFLAPTSEKGPQGIRTRFIPSFDDNLLRADQRFFRATDPDDSNGVIVRRAALRLRVAPLKALTFVAASVGVYGRWIDK